MSCAGGQMWAAARVQRPHESARCFSVVNLPVTWLPESSAGSAGEGEIRIRVDTSARPRCLVRTHVNAQVREPWRPHTRFLQSKKSRVICIHLHQLAATEMENWDKTVQEGRKGCFQLLLRHRETTAETRFQGVALTDGQADTSTLKD